MSPFFLTHPKKNAMASQNLEHFRDYRSDDWDDDDYEEEYDEETDEYVRVERDRDFLTGRFETVRLMEDNKTLGEILDAINATKVPTDAVQSTDIPVVSNYQKA